MSNELEKVEPIIGHRVFETGYRYYSGPVRGKFLTELRDNKRIVGIRCPNCNRVYAPPKPTCPKCFTNLDEFIELSGKGTLIAYTVVNHSEPLYPLAPPFAYGVIQLDGADTGMVHLLREVTPDEIKIGMRVQAVFKEKRAASILDIKYFKPIEAA